MKEEGEFRRFRLQASMAPDSHRGRAVGEAVGRRPDTVGDLGATEPPHSEGMRGASLSAYANRMQSSVCPVRTPPPGTARPSPSGPTAVFPSAPSRVAIVTRPVNQPAFSRPDQTDASIHWTTAVSFS